MTTRPWVVLGCALCACGAIQTANGGAGGGGGGAAGGSGGAGGGGGSGGGAATAMSCASATAALCERASACGAGSAKIVVSVPTATAEHASLSDCKNYYLFLVCPNAEGDAGARDWAGCQTAVAQSACAASSKGESALLPAACPGLTL